MKKTAALLLLIGLVNSAAVYAQETPPSPPAVPSNQIDLQKIKTNDDYVTLNFTNVDISALVKVMSELTRRNFVLDERVTGKVTIMTPTKISPDEAYQVLLSALEIKGFTAIEDGKVTRIIPTATARQSGLKVYQDGDRGAEGFITKLIRLNFVNPQEIVRTIAPLVTRDGSMIAYPPTNSIIITDSVSNIRKIESLIHAMDVAAPEGKGKINVYYLKNANAEDIAKLMQALVSRLPAPPQGGVAQLAGPSTILEGQVTITADKATNSLIIVASPGDYETMKDMIQKLDIRRRQVYVEAAIVEMSLAKARELGFEFQATNFDTVQSSNTTAVIGGTNFGNIATAATGPAGLATLTGLNVGAVKGTFTFNGVQYLNIGALLHALQTDSDVNVLSTPNILTTDNQKAEIMVGENVPFITGQTQNATTGSTNVFNTIERKDVGITLRLTPQITSDDNVRLEIYQEISAVIPSSSTAASTGPTTSKRSASTTVVVKDRETMVIGGLISDNVTSSTSKVPLLGDIPLLGWLFKFKTTKIEKTNLMIFITPYIIKTAADAEELTHRKNDTLEQYRKEYRIEKKGTEPALQPKTSGAAEQVGEKPAPKEQESAGTLQTSPTNTTEKEDPNAALKSAPTDTTAPAPKEGVR